LEYISLDQAREDLKKKTNSIDVKTEQRQQNRNENKGRRLLLNQSPCGAEQEFKNILNRRERENKRGTSTEREKNKTSIGRV